MTLVRKPIYQQLNQALREMIQNGEFKQGEQFLTERQISERFKVSRATANKALSNLVSEGVLEFRKGIGTFLRGSVFNYDLRTLASFTEKARSCGKKPSTRVLAFETIPSSKADASVRTALNVNSKKKLHYMERLRLADKTPIILERRYISAELCLELTRRDCSGSLYLLFKEQFGLTVTEAKQAICAENLKASDAEHLGVASGTAALLVECVGFIEQERPLWHERTLYRADQYAFYTHVSNLHTSQIGTFRNQDNR